MGGALAVLYGTCMLYMYIYVHVLNVLYNHSVSYRILCWGGGGRTFLLTVVDLIMRRPKNNYF